MAAFPNYYVGSNLSDIGRFMSMDRDSEERANVARMEQNRLAAAQIAKALQDRQQFEQELAFRQMAQNQQNQYQNALLGLKQREMDFGQSGISEAAKLDDQYRYAALRNAIELGQIRQNTTDPRILEEKERQKQINNRAFQEAMDNFDYETNASISKAADYNARAQEIENQAKAIESAKHFRFGNAEKNKIEADKYRTEQYAALHAAQSVDRRPGTISPDATGRRFVPITPRRPVHPDQPYGMPQVPGVPRNGPLPGLGGGQFYNPAAAISPSGRGVMVQVRLSDGRRAEIPDSSWPAVQAQDPGAVLITVNRPGEGSYGATGSWEEPPQQGINPTLLRSLYSNNSVPFSVSGVPGQAPLIRSFPDNSSFQNITRFLNSPQ